MRVMQCSAQDADICSFIDERVELCDLISDRLECVIAFGRVVCRIDALQELLRFLLERGDLADVYLLDIARRIDLGCGAIAACAGELKAHGAECLRRRKCEYRHIVCQRHFLLFHQCLLIALFIDADDRHARPSAVSCTWSGHVFQIIKGHCLTKIYRKRMCVLTRISATVVAVPVCVIVAVHDIHGRTITASTWHGSMLTACFRAPALFGKRLCAQSDRVILGILLRIIIVDRAVADKDIADIAAVRCISQRDGAAAHLLIQPIFLISGCAQAAVDIQLDHAVGFAHQIDRVVLAVIDLTDDIGPRLRFLISRCAKRTARLFGHGRDALLAAQGDAAYAGLHISVRIDADRVVFSLLEQHGIGIDGIERQRYAEVRRSADAVFSQRIGIAAQVQIRISFCILHFDGARDILCVTCGSDLCARADICVVFLSRIAVNIADTAHLQRRCFAHPFCRDLYGAVILAQLRFCRAAVDLCLDLRVDSLIEAHLDGILIDDAGRNDLRRFLIRDAELIDLRAERRQRHFQRVSVADALSIRLRRIRIDAHLLQIVHALRHADQIIQRKGKGLFFRSRIDERDEALLIVPCGVAIHILRWTAAFRGEQLGILQHFMIAFRKIKRISRHLPFGIVHDARRIVQFPERRAAHRVVKQEFPEHIRRCVGSIRDTVDRIMVVDVLQWKLDLIGHI